MKYQLLIFWAGFVVLNPLRIYSQDSITTSFFTQRQYNKALVCENSSTLTKISLINVPGIQKNQQDIGNLLTEVHLGTEVPIYYLQKPYSAFSLFLPISIHVLWATFEPQTAPILNNDYRFGFSMAYIHRFQYPKLRNLSLKLTPFAHESCHLGDEVTIAGLENDKFFRINVSYEYTEFALTLNDPDTIQQNLLTFRAGLMALINPKKGYYSYDTTETQGILIYPTDRWLEYYFQIQYRNRTSFFSSHKWQFVWSVEVRNRIKYLYLTDKTEPREWNINNYLGYDYSPKGKKGKPTIGNYFVLYKGINYHGQLRNSKLGYIGYSLVVYLP